MQMYLECQ